MFTAVSIMQLIDEGKLSLDTKAVEYLNLETTKIPNSVTIFQLLTHTSGIADYYDEDGSAEGDWEKLWESYPIYNMRKLNDYYEMFKDSDPVSCPGEKFHYNGAGYILLGMIIEKASGMDYFDYVRKNVFEKAGMKASDFLSLDISDENVAEGYDPIENSEGKITGWRKNIYLSTPDAASDGGSVSSAEDLIKFIQALKGGKLLSKDSTELMLTPKVLDQDSNGARGYIWKYGFGNYFVLSQEEKIVRGGHPGEEYGVSARLSYYSAQGVDVVILSNQGLSAGKIVLMINDMIIK
jgi:CubicO group peptidase (beta-lactamase class C family)